MASPDPLADWEKVGTEFYRKVRVYDAPFSEELGLENYIVAGAPYGGALGMDFVARVSLLADLNSSISR